MEVVGGVCEKKRNNSEGDAKEIVSINPLSSSAASSVSDCHHSSLSIVVISKPPLPVPFLHYYSLFVSFKSPFILCSPLLLFVVDRNYYQINKLDLFQSFCYDYTSSAVVSSAEEEHETGDQGWLIWETIKMPFPEALMGN